MVQLQEDLDEIEAAGIQVVGISYDSVETLKKFADERKITFPLLSDAGTRTIDAYRIGNKDVRAGSRQDGIPLPATFLVDSQGVIRAKLSGTTRERHTTAELIEAAKRID